jgi:hypothetical protein
VSRSSISCRLQLHPAFLARQQALLQARVLHMLLPLQQAAADAGQAGTLEQQQQQQQQKGSEPSALEQHSCDMTLQLEVLRRVQGFVSGLTQARVEQQQQVLPQLQKQLKQVATALEQDARQPASSNEAAADQALLSAGDSDSEDDASVDSSEEDAVAETDLASSQLCPNHPSLAELVGFGNMQQLLLLERQRDVRRLTEQFQTLDLANVRPEEVLELNAFLECLLQANPQMSEEQAHPLVWQHYWGQQLQQGLLEQLVTFPAGRHLLLTSGFWTGLECLVQQPQKQLAFWAACADAEEVRQQFEPAVDHSREYSLGAGQHARFYNLLQRELAHDGFTPPGGWGASPSSSRAEQVKAANAWQQQQLPQLLQRHAGLSEAEAQDVTDTCVTLHKALRQLERRGVAVAVQQLWDALLVVRKPRPQAVNHLQAASADSSSSTAEVLDGFWVSYREQSLPCSMEQALQNRCMAVHSGPASVFGLASLLVRAALCQLPGQQPSALQPAAAAAAPELQEQLLERQALLQELSKLVQQVETSGLQQYLQWTRKGDGYYQQNSYHQLRSYQQQETLQRLLEIAVQLRPTGAAALASNLIRASKEQAQLHDHLKDVLLHHTVPTGPRADAAAALCTVYGMLNTSTILHYVQQQGQQQQQQGQQQLQQQLQQLMLQHYLTWAAGSSSSSSSIQGSSNRSLFQLAAGPRGFLTAAATRCGLSLPVQPHDALLVLINAANYLLDAVEPVVADWVGKVLAEGLEARKISTAEAELADQDRETLQQLLGNFQLPAKEWQQIYQQGRGQLERVKGQLPALAKQLQAAATTLTHWSWSLQQLLQTAQALSSLVRAVERSLVTVVRVQQDCAAAAPQQQQADEGNGSAAGAADASAAQQQQQQQQLALLHERLALLQAASSAVASQAVRDKFAEVRRLADRVKSDASEAEGLAKTVVVPPAAAGSNIVQVRHQVGKTLDTVQNVCNAIQDIQHQLQMQGGAAEGLGVAAAAAGLGLVAALGLWRVPPDAKGCSMNEEQVLRAAHGSSGGGSNSSSGDADNDSSWEDSFLADAQQQATVLELHAVELESEDMQQLMVVLRHLGPQQPDLQSNGSSSSSAASSVVPRRRVVRVMKRQCGTSQAAEAAAEAAAPELDDGSECTGQEAVLSALWGLLLAVKPSVAAALHCASLPAACRSYEAFERAVLGWPPQQADADAQLQQQQQGRSSNGDVRVQLCSCGKPGHGYAVLSLEDHRSLLAEHRARLSPLAAGAAAAAADNAAAADVGDWRDLSRRFMRAVCADPVCVSRELQQLAQQGPPEGMQGEDLLLMHLMLAVQKDLVWLPEEFRYVGIEMPRLPSSAAFTTPSRPHIFCAVCWRTLYTPMAAQICSSWRAAMCCSCQHHFTLAPPSCQCCPPACINCIACLDQKHSKDLSYALLVRLLPLPTN